MISTGEIRRELSALTPQGVICHDVWRKLRAAADVRGKKVDRDGWIRLCAAFALYKIGRRPINRVTVGIFIRQHGDDPVAFLPGLMPTGAPRRMVGKIRGADLSKWFEETLGIYRSEDTIRLWCIQAGLEYGRWVEYSQEEVKLIIHSYAKAQRNRRITGLKNFGVAA